MRWILRAPMWRAKIGLLLIALGLWIAWKRWPGEWLTLVAVMTPKRPGVDHFKPR